MKKQQRRSSEERDDVEQEKSKKRTKCEKHHKDYEGETLPTSGEDLNCDQSQNEIAVICSLGSQISAHILQICASGNHQIISLNREERRRFQFLRDTIGQILNCLSLQIEKTPHQKSSFLLFLGTIITQMTELNKMLKKISRFQCALTPNFDIFEFTLRNHFQEIRSLFFHSSKNFTPTSLIEDTKARNVWESVFDKNRFYVTFSEFLRMLESQKIADPTSKKYDLFQKYLRYFIDFPSRDMVTTYRWNWLIRLFGPCDTFFENFTRIATGAGFLGLTNRIQADEILTMVHQSQCYLIRMSRTEPQYLAFSYRNSTGDIGHVINKDPETGLPIPVDQFVQSKFSNFTPVNNTLDVERILQASSASEPLLAYASFPSGYTARIP